MLDFIILSKTRNKLLIKFFLFDGAQSYLRLMEKEFNESSNAIRKELNRFIDAGLLISEYRGRKRYYMANTEHPFYTSFKSFVRRTLGIDQIAIQIADKIKNLNAAYITGCKLCGNKELDFIELVLIGQNLNEVMIESLVKKTEKLIATKISHISFTSEQMKYFSKEKPKLLIWQKK
jgi:hypothetical protein